MRSIFARVLFWFVASVVATLAAFAVTSLVLSVGRPDPFDFFGQTIALQAEDARRAYEEGGRHRLAEFLGRLNRAYRVRHLLTDATGRDLVDNTDRSELLDPPDHYHHWPPHRVEGGFAMVHPSADGRYRLVTLVPPPKFELWGFLPYYLWMLPVAGGLCYVLAAHFAAPLRRLREAVERFGSGDLSARIGSTRTDEIGDVGRAFDRMAERIETLLNAERRLLQDVSHELRSPLARLGFALELARTGPDRESGLSRARREADRLAALVDELLRLTRSEGDPSTREFTDVALDELLRSLVADVAVEAQARDCRLELKADEPVVVAGDEELLRRATENVVRNAVRHAPEGSPIEIELGVYGDAATIRVRDHGPGVPTDRLEAIFEPFVRVDADRGRASGGVGLGLAIARRAVRLHQGRITASNAAPGLVVVISLPGARTGVESLAED